MELEWQAATPIFWLFQGLNKKNFENQTEIGGYVCCRHPKILDRVPALPIYTVAGPYSRQKNDTYPQFPDLRFSLYSPNQ